jgi:hypothetical protein
MLSQGNERALPVTARRAKRENGGLGWHQSCPSPNEATKIVISVVKINNTITRAIEVEDLAIRIELWGQPEVLV